MYIDDIDSTSTSNTSALTTISSIGTHRYSNIELAEGLRGVDPRKKIKMGWGGGRGGKFAKILMFINVTNVCKDKNRTR